jgi:phospho-N-acetylmuramoyl-pentapeptide-transferase
MQLSPYNLLNSTVLASLLAHPILWLLAFALPFVVALVGYPIFIEYLKSLRVEQFIREDGPDSHHIKKGTPTGGGIFLLGVWLVFSLIFGILLQGVYYVPVLTSAYFYTPVIVTLGLKGLGMWDDLAKVMKKQNKGLSGYAKLAIQACLGLFLGLIMIVVLNDTGVNVFGKTLYLPHWMYMLYTTFVTMAFSNAVNLTDGLDGLAGSTTALSIYMIALLIATMALTQAGGLTAMVSGVLLCLVLIACLLAFLVYNRYPARVFMGDSGSLALGGFIAATGLMFHLDGWLLLIGGLYALEALSVILQVASFKLTRRRLFRMAPMHHHFELCGMHETQVVKMFLAFHGILCMVAFYLQRMT